MYNISIIEPVGGHGGMNYYDFGLARGLVTSGCDVTLFTCDRTEESSEVGISVVKCFRQVFGKDNKYIRFFRYIRALFTVYSHLHSQQHPLAHFHFFHISLLELLSLLFVRLAGAKIVVTLHDVESFSSKNNASMCLRVLKLVDHFIVHNDISSKTLNSYLHSFNLVKPVTIIPHGHYIDWVVPISQNNAREKLNLESEEKVLLFFGQIKTVKGLDVLLSALPLVVKTHPKVKLVIAGKVWKDDFSVYQGIIDKHNLHNHVQLNIRYIPDDEVNAFYCAADFVVLPYKQIFQSGVLLMSMSYNRPVIVSDLPGMTEIVNDSYNGFVFQSENIKSLADCICSALSMNPGEITTITAAAQQVMLTRHSWELIGQSTTSIYKTLLKDI